MISQFSGYHSFLPSLFSKLTARPHYIILNGTECNNFPEYNYGYMLRPLLFWFSKKSLAWATGLLPVSSSLVDTNYTYKETRYKQQGFKAFYKNVDTPYKVIHNGISADRFKIDAPGERNPATFITVATGLDSANRRAIKGLDLVIDLARLTPENHYTFIGALQPTDLELPENINIVGYVPHNALVNYYNKHAFYLQLSVSEGFGISVCEAMLCGCIPIVSDVGMLPDIAGKDGYVLERKNVNDLTGLVKRAMDEYSPEKMTRCRNHIIEHFDIAIRKAKLLAIE